MTAYAMHGDRERILARGLDGYIGKPIDWEELVAGLQRWLPLAEEQAEPGVARPWEGVPYFDDAILKRLGERVGADRIEGIVSTFVAELERRLEAIARSRAASDCAGVAKEVHPLKSSSAEIGAHRLSVLAAEIESAALSGDTAAVTNCCGTLDDITEETRRRLLEFGVT